MLIPHNYRPPAELLQGRVILVTGAGDGFGEAIAEQCAAHGATVVLLGRTTPKLGLVYDAIEQAGGPQPAIYPLHLESASPKNYADLAATLGREFGRLDGVVHNAAFLGTLTPTGLYNAELWYQVMQVNLNAPFLLTQSCLPLLQQAEQPALLFINDAVGLHGKAYWGAYAAAKAGLLNLAQTLADELESNQRFRVNTLVPPPMRTHLRAQAYPGEDPRRRPRPSLYTAAALYLLGPDCVTTGQLITLQAPHGDMSQVEPGMLP